MSRPHYISMVGLAGCIPSQVEVHQTKGEALEYLIWLLEIPKYGKIARALRQNNFSPIEGLEYASIERCSCDTPEVHRDL